MNPTDQQLDQRLRDVSPPPDLLERLHAIPADADVEFSLADVEPPPRFLERVHDAVAESALEAHLERAPNLAAAVARLHNIPYEQRQRRRKWSGWLTGATATAVALAVQAAALLIAIQASRPPTRRPEIDMVEVTTPVSLTSRPAPPPLIVARPDPIPVEAPEDWGPVITPPNDLNHHPWSDVAALIHSGANLDENLILTQWGVLGAPNDPEATTPELELIAIDPPRGVEPPLLRGAYDRAFLLREKESPPLSPAHPDLAHSRPPLTTSVESVDLVRRMAKRDRLPEDNSIRVEDFVAAQHYGYPARPGAVGLQAFGGPSRFSPNQAWMMQIGAAVGRLAQQPPPTHWTLALDVSSGMAWRNRMANARRTVERLMREMRRDDRLSLVAFREDAWLAASFATRDQVGEVLEVLESWEPRGRCDFVAGVQQGISAAADGGFQGERRLVVLSDGRTRWPEAVSQQILNLHRRSQSLEIDWHWVELASEGEADPTLVNRLREQGAQAKQLADRQEAVWPVLEAWYRRSLVRAVDAELHVRFEPKSVRFHRLVGHRASAWAGLQPTEQRIDLRAGDESTVLYEIWVHPQGPPLVAVATLSWRDPRSGEPKLVRRRITRADFAMNFRDSSPALQYAALAAEAGEVLSRSYFAVNRSRTLREVLAATDDVAGALQQRENFRRFAEWLRELERIRQRRGD